jgi:hypothetical protein
MTFDDGSSFFLNLEGISMNFPERNACKPHFSWFLILLLCSFHAFPHRQFLAILEKKNSEIVFDTYEEVAYNKPYVTL